MDNLKKKNQSIHQSPNKLVVISSISGGGKTTLTNWITQKYSDIGRVITTTTRKPRPKEINGKEYHFFSKEQFETYIQENRMIEYTKIYDEYYGIQKQSIDEAFKRHQVIIFNIDYKGLKRLRKMFPPEILISIFLVPICEEVWKKRLKKRCREDNSVTDLEHRLKMKKEELATKKHYDHIVVNDNLKTTAHDILKICAPHIVNRAST